MPQTVYYTNIEGNREKGEAMKTYSNKELKKIYAESETTVCMFEHEQGWWGCVEKFYNLFYVNVVDSLRAGCEPKHFKTLRGAVNYVERHGFTVCA